MANNPIGWFEIYVDDMERAKRFYKSMFDTSLIRLDSPEIEMWAFPSDMSAYGVLGALVRMPEVPSGNKASSREEV